MVSNPVPQDQNNVEYVFFAGDSVRLAGQFDYPHAPLPMNGYPPLFVIQHATSTSRSGYSHYTRLLDSLSVVLFRWDKRGTGKSAAGAAGSLVVDTLNAYQEALRPRDVDEQRAIILAHNEGTLLLAEAFEKFSAISKPLGIVLVGNMLDERKITRLNVPVHILISKNDWNDWRIYGEGAAKAHAAKHGFAPSFFVAPNTNRRLMYDNTSTFHSAAMESIQNWLKGLLWRN